MFNREIFEKDDLVTALCKYEYFEQKYKQAEEKRIQLVNEIEQLDNELEQKQQEIKKTKFRTEINEQYKEKDKDRFKDSAKRTLFGTAVTMIVVEAVNHQNMIVSMIRLIMAIAINATANYIPYFYFKKSVPDKKIKNIKQLEKEYEEILRKRILLGSQYKKVRESEVIAEKTYKRAKEIYNYVREYRKTPPDIKTLKTTLDWPGALEIDFGQTPKEMDEKEKVEILDQALREHLMQKITKCYFNTITEDELEIYTTKELITLLTEQITNGEELLYINCLTKTIIDFISSIQNNDIIWEKSNDRERIDNAKFIYNKEGKLTKIESFNDSNNIYLLKEIYEIIVNYKITSNKTKIRRKNKKAS